jgi:hypothetical protein
LISYFHPYFDRLVKAFEKRSNSSMLSTHRSLPARLASAFAQIALFAGTAACGDITDKAQHSDDSISVASKFHPAMQPGEFEVGGVIFRLPPDVPATAGAVWFLQWRGLTYPNDDSDSSKKLLLVLMERTGTLRSIKGSSDSKRPLLMYAGLI